MCGLRTTAFRVVGMKRVVALIAVLIAVGAYVYNQRNETQRFRLIVEVETPNGSKSGSSVIETRAFESGSWGPIEARGVRHDFKGRAVVIDLGSGKTLVGLLAFGPNGTDQNKLFRVVSAALAPGRTVDWTEEYKLKGSGVLPADYTPTLIAFADPADPKSAALVNRLDLERTLGPGFRFVQARLETTNDPVSLGIEKLLPWWNRPNRPAAQAYHAWLEGSTAGPSVEPELLFQKE